MANVSPLVSVGEILQAVITGKTTPEKAATVLPQTEQTRRAVLAAIAAGQLKPEQGLVLLPVVVKNGNGNGGNLHVRRSTKNAVSVYGLQRMPVTLYAQQWERLLAYAEEIRKFIAEHKAELSYK